MGRRFGVSLRVGGGSCAALCQHPFRLVGRATEGVGLAEKAELEIGRQGGIGGLADGVQRGEGEGDEAGDAEVVGRALGVVGPSVSEKLPPG